MSPEVIQEFRFDECQENRTWETISKQGPNKFKTGGIGGLASQEDSKTWVAWGCWQGHACLTRLAGVGADDYMCYVYHEQQEAWYPWGIRSKLMHDNFCSA